MRRQGGHYGGNSGGGGGSYGGAASQMHQQQNSKSGYYQGRHQEQQTPGEKEGGHQNNQWRWEPDASQPKLPQTAMSPTAPSSFSEGQGREPPRSYYQDQRVESRTPLERQGGGGPRSQAHEEDMDIGYEDTHTAQTYEGLEKRFLDDIMKLYTEKTNAEDAENARHREKLSSVNVQYEEQLAALRARHVSQRDEFLRRESQARKEQYQKTIMEPYPTSGVPGPGPGPGPGNPRDFNAPAGEPHQVYNSDSYDSYRDRGRYPGNARDHGYDSKVPYPRSRAYNTGSRYY